MVRVDNETHQVEYRGKSWMALKRNVPIPTEMWALTAIGFNLSTDKPKFTERQFNEKLNSGEIKLVPDPLDN